MEESLGIEGRLRGQTHGSLPCVQPLFSVGSFLGHLAIYELTSDLLLDPLNEHRLTVCGVVRLHGSNTGPVLENVAQRFLLGLL